MQNPDISMASGFLELLELNGEFSFQTFDDNKERKDKSLARVLHGTLADHAGQLREMQERGAGVFVTINRTDLRGRAEPNITAVRAVFVDLDGSPIEPVLAHALRPSLVVLSSPNRFHAYWFVSEDFPLEQFKPTQKNLSKIFNGDPSVCDLPRVMRLPGFLHLKDKPFMTKIWSPQ